LGGLVDHEEETA
jgi:hypothetical protein